MASSTKMLETEMKIQQAFMTLMHQEGFGKLSVQQLAKLAGISRGTFYLHYFDKYDLLAHYEDEMIGHVKSIFAHFPKPLQAKRAANLLPERDAFFQLFKYLYRQRDLAVLLLNENQTQLTAKVKQLVVELLRQGGSELVADDRDVPSDYAQEIVSQGVVDLIVYWLNQTPVRSPESVYSIFRTTRHLTPEQLTARR